MSKLVRNEKIICGGIQNATELIYDNSSSGLSSTSVQNAIDEISQDIPGAATTATAGLVKPDGKSITVDSAGTIKVGAWTKVGSVTGATAIAYPSNYNELLFIINDYGERMTFTLPKGETGAYVLGQPGTYGGVTASFNVGASSAYLTGVTYNGVDHLSDATLILYAR